MNAPPRRRPKESSHQVIMQYRINPPTPDDEPRDDTPEGRAYWREYGRAEREHAEQLRNDRVRANVQRSTFGTR